jgi:hypothetical protein
MRKDPVRTTAILRSKLDNKCIDQDPSLAEELTPFETATRSLDCLF